MTILERSQLLAALYKLHADSVALLLLSQAYGSISVGITATDLRDLCQDKIDEMQGREPEIRPVQLAFCRR